MGCQGFPIPSSIKMMFYCVVLIFSDMKSSVI